MNTSRTYQTFGDALADPASAIARFVREGEQAMTHNPTTVDEWSAYLAWTREHPQGSTEAWRASLAA